MRYRRLGETELMVSEVGLDVRALDGMDEESAASVIRAAITSGITVMAWDVSDGVNDLEPLLARAAGLERGRLTLVAMLDHVPPPENVGPQVGAITSRLGEGASEGFVDIVTFPGEITEGHLAAFEELRSRGRARFAGHYAASRIRLPGGVLAFAADEDDAMSVLSTPEVACALVPVASLDAVLSLSEVPARVCRRG